MVKSNKGVEVDMAALAKANENTIALTSGGVSMNARGDILGPGGVVVKKVEDITKEINEIPKRDSHRVSLADIKRFKAKAQKDAAMVVEKTANLQVKEDDEQIKEKK